MVIGSQPALRYPCLPPANNGNGFWRLKDCETGTRARSRNTQLPGDLAGQPRHDGKSRCPDEPVATSRLAQVAVRAQMRSHEEWTGWDLNPEYLRTMARCLSASRHLSATPQIRTYDLDFAPSPPSCSGDPEPTQSRDNTTSVRTATITVRPCRAFLPLFSRGSRRPSDIPESRPNRVL